MPPEIPGIRRENDCTIFSARVNIKQGLHARPSMQIVDACTKYNVKVTLTSDGGQKIPADGKRIMQIMQRVGTSKGARLEIRIEGETEEAEKLAMELYNGIELRGYEAIDK